MAGLEVAHRRTVRFDGGGTSTVDGIERLLTPGEVARIFRVNPKTVTRWAIAGRVGIRTLGGHRRFGESEITALLADPERDASCRPG